jgi:outer membrane protein OmpA-like peptidoglycan-associated protein
MIKHYRLLSLTIFMVLNLTACGIWPISHDAYNNRQKHMDSLREQGVQVEQVGHNVTILIPSDAAFEAGTATINEDYQSTLLNVAGFIKRFGNVQVTVTGYTDAVMEPEQAQILSRAQADSIVAYLWAHGIPHQCMYARGSGAECPIAQNDTVAGSAKNRRVEITLRQN